MPFLPPNQQCQSTEGINLFMNTYLTCGTLNLFVIFNNNNNNYVSVVYRIALPVS